MHQQPWNLVLELGKGTKTSTQSTPSRRGIPSRGKNMEALRAARQNEKEEQEKEDTPSKARANANSGNRKQRRAHRVCVCEFDFNVKGRRATVTEVEGHSER